MSLFARLRSERSRPDPADLAGTRPTATAATPAPAVVIDALGRKCPIPIIMAAERIRDVRVGEIIAVRADDPAAYTDIPAWCGLKSHELAYREPLDPGSPDQGWEFGIRRQY